MILTSHLYAPSAFIQRERTTKTKGYSHGPGEALEVRNLGHWSALFCWSISAGAFSRPMAISWHPALPKIKLCISYSHHVLHHFAKSRAKVRNDSQSYYSLAASKTSLIRFGQSSPAEPDGRIDWFTHAWIPVSFSTSPDQTKRARTHTHLRELFALGLHCSAILKLAIYTYHDMPLHYIACITAINHLARISLWSVWWSIHSLTISSAIFSSV